MIIAVAGIPHEHFNRIQKIATRIFGSSPVFVGTPLRPNGDGRFEIDSDHMARLGSSLVKLIKAQPKAVETGCGMIILSVEGQDVSNFTMSFRPSVLVQTASLPEKVMTRGRKGEEYANRLASVLRTAFIPLTRAVGAMRTELSDRINRTPLLLPLRNFDAPIVTETIMELADTLPQAADPGAMIVEACKRIEAQFAFGRYGGSQRRCFTNTSEIQFRSPNGALHGVAVSDEPPHNRDCLLNGTLRLGSAYTAGFHYDCIRDRSEGRRRIPLSGTFFDCHSDKSRWTGTPHLNIAPNDFVR
ncbi:hypothetical protein [Sphingomonas echinoides]|uniref:Uncharacterized protein n=1 Tax=Sphingomonas echinoides TaxID=59803 RepID=A0ABU4PT61_9SPHN|nr:hypothetical protein [Sphingomonas echinoides]MDX5986382.1 hypothetical protein [Sphingomonas echinoides]